MCRLCVAFVWLYHGLVPKLLGPHRDELVMNMALGLSEEQAIRLATAAGILEVLVGVSVLACWRQRWPLLLTAVAMPGLLVFVAVWVPDLLWGAFNPVTTNLCATALAIVALGQHNGRGRSGEVSQG
ncbi:hypothetical protein FVW59_05260 [Parahaliea aestuarii]|uniref:DoxX family protein n=2 Tax=Parahaliea aestuarii TaxID=1852021 RepID=A0A5C9A1G0_9GAMM|nr:DoxX-like family protein [Parahaliea aestuarii]TXS93620.1 hypothetical protein FVW59_05260 [Parahaliea aestuarii]